MAEITSTLAALDLTSKTSPSQHNTRAPLLCLPGELRNRIYAFVAQERTQKIRNSLAHGELRDFLRKTANPHNDGQFMSYRRQDWGLTQVCRRIRQEYLPIHKMHTTYHILNKDSAAYTRAFVLGGGRVNAENALGKVIIDISFNGGFSDILPLIKLCGVANNHQQQLVVSFQHGPTKFTAKKLEQLFYVNSNMKWKKFIDDNVSGLVIKSEIFNTILVLLYIKPHTGVKSQEEAEFCNLFMRELPNIDKNTDWKDATGLSFLLELRKHIVFRREYEKEFPRKTDRKDDFHELFRAAQLARQL